MRRFLIALSLHYTDYACTIISFFGEISPDTHAVMKAVVSDPAYVGAVRSVRELTFFAVERWTSCAV